MSELGTCTWTEDSELGNFETECGNAHVFIDGNCADNGYEFCPYCGKNLEEVTP